VPASGDKCGEFRVLIPQSINTGVVYAAYNKGPRTRKQDSDQLLYLVQRSVETTYYTVNGHCSCRPANIRFFRPGIFK
jgi:hypothetical protein